MGVPVGAAPAVPGVAVVPAVVPAVDAAVVAAVDAAVDAAGGEVAPLELLSDPQAAATSASGSRMMNDLNL